MTPKQILDSFSETLMRDNRILSAQERALVATLLQHASRLPVIKARRRRKRSGR